MPADKTKIYVFYGEIRFYDVCKNCWRSHNGRHTWHDKAADSLVNEDKWVELVPDHKGLKVETTEIDQPGAYSVTLTIHDRQKTYGVFAEQSVTAQNLKEVMESAPNWGSLAPDQKEALQMAATKISRILHGDPDYRDSWHDVGGFMSLVDKRLGGEAV